MRVNDIIEMAVRVENDGELFYTEAARIAEDPKVRKTFEQLAAQEKAHAASFRKLLEDQDEEWDEIDAYLSTYASANIIPDLNLIVPELKRMTVSEVI
ncbi:MAG TPA: ferritin, partial [Thermotogae bacterium]|nr:ferritin [Thermotogota bacterium]